LYVFVVDFILVVGCTFFSCYVYL